MGKKAMSEPAQVWFEEHGMLSAADFARALRALESANATASRVFLSLDFAAPPRLDEYRLDEYRLPELPKAPQPKDWYRRFEKRARV